MVKLVDFLDNHAYVGIAGSYIEGPDGVFHHTAFRFPSLISELEAGLGFGPASKLLKDWIVPLPMPERTQQVDWLAGASMMIRRQVLEKIGLFDETFFLYFEETDLCRRSLVAGWPTYYVKDSVVVHIGSATTGMKDKARPMPRFWFDSRKHYFEKHHGPLYLRASNVAWAGGHLLWQVRKVIQRKRRPHPPGLLRDFIKHNFFPPDVPEADVHRVAGAVAAGRVRRSSSWAASRIHSQAPPGPRCRCWSGRPWTGCCSRRRRST